MATETTEDVLTVDLRGRSAGERVRLRRLVAGLSQWDLAQRLGITQSAVSLAERGRLEAQWIERALCSFATGNGEGRQPTSIRISDA